MESVDVGIGTDYYLIPSQVIYVKIREVLCALRLYLYPTPEDFNKVRDNLTLEYFVVIDLQAVEDLSAYGYDSLKIGVARLLTRAESRITLNYKHLALVNVLASAVDKFRDPVGDIYITRELLLDVQTRFFSVLTASFIDQNLSRDFFRFKRILNEVYLKAVTQELGHRFLDTLVRYSLFSLVFVGCNAREGRNTKHETVLNIIEFYFAFVLCVLVV